MPTLALPRLGETMESGRVVAWLKQPGESFQRGETLVEIESDKTVVELPALADGMLLEVLALQGQDVAVGEPLCRYEGAGTPEAASVPEPAEPVAPAAPTAAAPVTTARLRATPVARRLARAGGVDLTELTGTGRRGRIEARDVRAVSAPEAAAGRHIIEVPGGRIAYQVWAAQAPRETGLLLHGFSGDATVWAGLAALLVREGITVVAPDLPAHGATALPAAGLDALVEAAAAVLDVVGGPPVHLAGHSLGAAVAVRLARLSPARIARLTLIAPAGLDGGIDSDFVQGMARVRGAGALAHLLRRLSVRPHGLSVAQLTAMAEGLAQGRLVPLADAVAFDGRQQLDIVPDLHALAVPLRILWGLRDQIIPWTQVARAGSRAAVHLIPDAGHMAHWDRPEEVASLLA